MKNLARCFVMLCIMGVSSLAYAQEWVAYREIVQPAPQTEMVYIAQPQPVVVYQWVPYVVQQNVIVEQHRLFCRTQTVMTRPFTQWVLQPVVVYR
jgi:hypothetical protein